MLLYCLLILDLSIVSMRISAFVLVCGRVIVEVGLFLRPGCCWQQACSPFAFAFAFAFAWTLILAFTSAFACNYIYAHIVCTFALT